MLDFLNTEEQKAAAEAEPQDEGADANIISADILDLPSGYRQAATLQGRVVRLDYQTTSYATGQPMLTPQTEAMKQLPQFSFGTDKRKHNFYYAVLPGASHTSSYAFQYAYNALLHLWKNEPGGDDTTSIKPVKM